MSEGEVRDVYGRSNKSSQDFIINKKFAKLTF